MLEEALRRGWEDLLGRLDGPLSFRLLIQPTVAIFLASRAGLNDARTGRPPFLWNVFVSANERRALLRQGWQDIGKVFIIAAILDAIYQVIVHSGIYTLELLLTASILALCPYLLVRGLVTRIAQLQQARIEPNTEPTQSFSQSPTRERKY